MRKIRSAAKKVGESTSEFFRKAADQRMMKYEFLDELREEEKEMNKSCNNCKYSYAAINFSNELIGQHCNNIYYNSPDYSLNEEDWKNGHCKYWDGEKK